MDQPARVCSAAAAVHTAIVARQQCTHLQQRLGHVVRVSLLHASSAPACSMFCLHSCCMLVSAVSDESECYTRQQCK